MKIKILKCWANRRRNFKSEIVQAFADGFRAQA